MLRALRAAEMAAWEAAGSTAPRSAAVPRSEGQHSAAPLPVSPPSGKEAVLFLALAGAAFAGLVVGLEDLSHLLNDWSQMVDGIRLLLL
jgi:hypothetical protein